MTSWQTAMWIAWASTFIGMIVTWRRVAQIGHHQAHHCAVGLTQGLALAQLLAALDDAGVVLPDPLRGIAEAYGRGEHDAVERLLTKMGDDAKDLYLEDVDVDDDADDEGRH
jgi:hypothetical protein